MNDALNQFDNEIALFKDQEAIIEELVIEYSGITRGESETLEEYINRGRKVVESLE